MIRIRFIILLLILTNSLFSQYHWNKYPDNPVLVPGEDGDWFYHSVGPGTVLFYDSSYHMYYDGQGESVKWAFGYATSLDGITWTKDSNNPILELGAPGQWDDYRISDPFVVKSDTIFHMWYSGRSKNSQFRIGHAASSDGIEWIKDTDNPVKDITEGLDNESFCVHGPVMYDGMLYHIFYSTGKWRSSRMEIWHATSKDGHTWIKDPDNPILWGSDISVNDYIYVTSAIFTGVRYILLFGKGPSWGWTINLAFSEDGSDWKIYDHNPVLTAGAADNWDGLCITRTALLYDCAGHKYKMWYGGGMIQNEERIGYAESISSEGLIERTIDGYYNDHK